MNDEGSLVVGLDQVEKMQRQIAAGDNVVLFANHQSEADPQIYSVLMDPKVRRMMRLAHLMMRLPL